MGVGLLPTRSDGEVSFTSELDGAVRGLVAVLTVSGALGVASGVARTQTDRWRGAPRS
jgi:hypothetical protein